MTTNTGPWEKGAVIPVSVMTALAQDINIASSDVEKVR